AIQVKADNYLLKPIKSDELIKTITTAIKNLDTEKQKRDSTSEESLFAEMKQSNFLDELFKNELSVPQVIDTASQLFHRQLVAKHYTVLLANNNYNSSLADYTQLNKYLSYLFSNNPNVIF